MSDGHDPRIEQVSFEPDDILFYENEETFHFFVIQEGQVEVFKTAVDGTRVVLGVMGEGTSIGEFAMLDHKPRSASARALTKVSAAKVSEEAYNELITELPTWAIAVMRGMIDRLRHTNDIIRRSGASDSVKKQVARSAEITPTEDDFGTNPFLTSNGDES